MWRIIGSGFKVFQIFQFTLFLGVSVFLFARSVDGTGAENTFDVAFFSFSIWLGFYLFLLATEFGIRFLLVIKKKWGEKFLWRKKLLLLF